MSSNDPFWPEKIIIAIGIIIGVLGYVFYLSIKTWLMTELGWHETYADFGARSVIGGPLLFSGITYFFRNWQFGAVATSIVITGATLGTIIFA